MNKVEFYKFLRSRDSGVFGTSLSASQVTGIEGILDAFRTHGDGRVKTLAYALATAYHETGGRMVPVREGFARTDDKARRIVARRKYGKVVNGQVYYGRGLVQLTWIDNYRASSADAGVDLVENPDAMLDPVISARVLIKGLIDGRWNARGIGIAKYLPTGGPDDLKGARRTVNITDKWQLIGEYYKAFLIALDAGEWAPKPIVLDATFIEPPEIEARPSGLVALVRAIINAILAMLGRNRK